MGPLHTGMRAGEEEKFVYLSKRAEGIEQEASRSNAFVPLSEGGQHEDMNRQASEQDVRNEGSSTSYSGKKNYHLWLS